MSERINNPFIYTEENFYLLKNIPRLECGQVYIYVIENSIGHIKIGKTKNISQRLKTLSGSNCGGVKPERLYCSPATFLDSIEKTCHNHFHFARLSGEWFDGTKLEFNDVVEYVNGLFYTNSYASCNEMRKKINDNKRN